MVMFFITLDVIVVILFIIAVVIGNIRHEREMKALAEIIKKLPPAPPITLGEPDLSDPIDSVLRDNLAMFSGIVDDTPQCMKDVFRVKQGLIDCLISETNHVSDVISDQRLKDICELWRNHDTLTFNDINSVVSLRHLPLDIKVNIIQRRYKRLA